MPPSKIKKDLTPDEFMNGREQPIAAPRPTLVKPKSSQPASDERRITGSSDIPLNADGKKESKRLADSLSEKFDLVLSSPEKRAMQTAKEFGNPIPLEGLGAWKRGALEGRPVKEVEGQVKYLIKNPDKRPPGVSKESKEPGQTFNEFARPFLATVQTILATLRPSERVLVVSHGGDIQTADAWIANGKPDDLSIDNAKMAQCPYWTVIDTLFFVDGKKFTKVHDNKRSGVYLLEHFETAYNPG